MGGPTAYFFDDRARLGRMARFGDITESVFSTSAQQGELFVPGALSLL